MADDQVARRVARGANLNSYSAGSSVGAAAHREQQSCDHEGKGDRVVPRTRSAIQPGQPGRSRAGRRPAGTPAATPDRSASGRTNNTTNHTLDGPALTLTGVRLTGLMVKSFFLRTLDLRMVTFAMSDSARRRPTSGDSPSLTQQRCPGREFAAGPRSRLAFLAVPRGCSPAGRPAGGHHPRRLRTGGEIRRSDAPPPWSTWSERPSSRGGSAHRPSAINWSPTIEHPSRRVARRADAALAAITRPLRSSWPNRPVSEPGAARPGLVIPLDLSRKRDAEGRLPVTPPPMIWSSTSRTSSAVLNALGVRAPRASKCGISGSWAPSAPRCVDNTLLLGGRTCGPPYVITAIGNARRHAGRPGRRAAGHAVHSSTRCGSVGLHRRPPSPGATRVGGTPRRCA